MKSTVVEIAPGQNVIAKSSWTKKKLADAHVEAVLFCEFGCRYCSSNAGLHLRFKKNSIEDAVTSQAGQSFDPHDAGDVVITYPGIAQKLDEELSRRKCKPGVGQTLVYSQLTDGFSPQLVQTGTARQILELLLAKTEYRIRVLTKNAVVSRKDWLRFFADHADRFVVGLSVGTLDGEFAHSMERRTSSPKARLKALHRLQDAGVPTYGMLCPVFPQVLGSSELEELIEQTRPELCEHVWAEPYNERHNWEHVRECYKKNPSMWDWMTRVFGDRDTESWSRYAKELYVRIHNHAVLNRWSWSDKLRYLLYEADITSDDAESFRNLDGVLLQSRPNKGDGSSKNPDFAIFQKARAVDAS